MKVLMLEKQR